MAGFFTDNRKTNIRVIPARTTYGGSWFANPSYETSVFQSTYSFRTNRVQDNGSLVESWQKTTQNGFTEMSSKQDTGHEFYSYTKQEHLSHEKVLARRFDTAYEGYLLPSRVGVTTGYPSFGRMSLDEIKLYGNKAIKSTSPTKPEVNLSTSAAELFREGLPSYHLKTPYLNRNGKFDSKNIGSDYLGAVFTWQPFITDVLKTIKALVSASETLTQFSRDQGRLVRRRFQFPMESETSVSEPTGGVIDYVYPDSSLYIPSGTRKFQFTQQVTTQRWFSGAFIYYINADDSLLGKIDNFMQKGNRLLGLRITPETLWELIPWSWLVDWFVCIQDALAVSTMLQNDALVLKYGYLMRHRVLTNTYTVSGAPLYGVAPGAVHQIFKVIQKERVKATPYGFGINLSALSSSQWAILGALGLTKAPNILP